MLGIAPGAPRIVVFVLLKSWDAIPRVEFRIPRVEFRIPRAALRIPWNSPRAPRMAFSLRERFFSGNWGGPRLLSSYELKCSKWYDRKAKIPTLSGPVLRSISAMPPSPFSERFPLGEHASWRCDAPPPPQKRGIAAILAQYPMKTRQNACDTPFCDTISKGYCAIWGGISHWAAISLRLSTCILSADGRYLWS